MDWPEQIHPLSRWKVSIITDSRDQLAFHAGDKRFNAVIISTIKRSESTVGLHSCTTIQRFENGADLVHWVASWRRLIALWKTIEIDDNGSSFRGWFAWSFISSNAFTITIHFGAERSHRVKLYTFSRRCRR